MTDERSGVDGTAGLPEFIDANRKEILSEWLRETRAAPAARGLNEATLLDHFPELLSSIAATLDELNEFQSPSLPSRPAKVHALSRLSVGYDVSAVVAEYTMLRECIVRRWEHTDGRAKHSAELRTLHRAIDRATAISVERYTLARERIDQVAEHVALTQGGRRLAIRQESIDYSALVREVVEERQATSSAHQLDLELNSELTVWGDRDRLAQVLGNLLGNAIKYSPKGGTIRIVVTQDAGVTTTSVSDRGVGISPDDQQRIFERYMRASSHLTADVPGHGIGLFIVSEIVRAHGGRLWVESSLGAGSTFHFTLPPQPPGSK